MFHVSRFNMFKKFFECINSKISLTCCTRTGGSTRKKDKKIPKEYTVRWCALSYQQCYVQESW